MILVLIIFISYINIFSLDLIPHIIHYAWFSENPKPEKIQRCISSWKKYSKDWLIIQWTSELIKPFDNDFIKEEYELKKYAFVADYLRVYALYTYGGIYIDSDVELSASLNPFLNHSFFVSQSRDRWLHVAPDCFGAQKGHPLLKEMLKFYRNHHFRDKNGNLDETWVGIRLSEIIQDLYKIKLKRKIIKPVILPNNGSIYPSFYFEQKKHGKINYANHLCTHSWGGEKYNIEKYLAKCYYDCRTNNINKLNQNCKKESFYINLIHVFLFIIFLLILMLLKKYKYTYIKKNNCFLN